jgi:hypothetical protein
MTERKEYGELVTNHEVVLAFLRGHPATSRGLYTNGRTLKSGLILLATRRDNQVLIGKKPSYRSHQRVQDLLRTMIRAAKLNQKYEVVTEFKDAELV